MKPAALWKPLKQPKTHLPPKKQCGLPFKGAVILSLPITQQATLRKYCEPDTFHRKKFDAVFLVESPNGSYCRTSTTGAGRTSTESHGMHWHPLIARINSTPYQWHSD